MQRRAFAVLFFSYVVAMAGVSLITPIMAPYAKETGASGLWIGLIFSGFSLSRAALMTPAGLLADRFGRKRFILLGLVIYGLAALGYLFAATPPALAAVRVFHGVGSAMVLPLAIAYVADLAPPGHEGRYLGTFNMALLLGWGIGPLLGGGLTHLAGYAAPFLAMSGLTFFAVLLILVWLPEQSPSPEEKARPAGARLMAILRDPLAQAVLVFRAGLAFANNVVYPLFALLALREGLNQLQIGFLLSFQLLGAVPLQRFFGRLADRRDRVHLMFVGGVAGAVRMFALVLCHSFGQFFAVACLSLVSSVGVPAGGAVNAKVGRRYGMGTAMSLFTTAFSVGMVAGPLVGGAVLDLWRLDMVFLVGGELELGALFLFLVLAERARRRGLGWQPEPAKEACPESPR